MKTELIARAIILNPENKVLLVSNDPNDFFYTPGGHLEENGSESLIECAKRETFEETGLNVSIKRLLYVEEWVDINQSERKVETIFLGLTSALTIPKNWQDTGGLVKTAGFFSQRKVADLPKVFPVQLYDVFWEDLQIVPKYPIYKVILES